MSESMNITGGVRQEPNGAWRAQVSLVTPISTKTGEATSMTGPAEAIGLAAHFAWKDSRD